MGFSEMTHATALKDILALSICMVSMDQKLFVTCIISRMSKSGLLMLFHDID